MPRKPATAGKTGPARPPGMKIKKGDRVIVIAGRDNRAGRRVKKQELT